MFKIVSDVIQNAIIYPQLFANLEHGTLKAVHGIVLHQTSNNSTARTLAGYRVRPVGAHFLISPEGVIYQTARVDKVCHHVGFLASQCRAEHTCRPTYLAAIERLEAGAMTPVEKRTIIHKLEMAKDVSQRYPSNFEAIGIEVVGAPVNNVYQSPTAAQNIASTWLVAKLLATYNLRRDRVFKHGVIGSAKTPSEARYVQY